MEMEKSIPDEILRLQVYGIAQLGRRLHRRAWTKPHSNGVTMPYGASAPLSHATAGSHPNWLPALVLAARHISLRCCPGFQLLALCKPDHPPCQHKPWAASPQQHRSLHKLRTSFLRDLLIDALLHSIARLRLTTIVALARFLRSKDSW